MQSCAPRVACRGHQLNQGTRTLRTKLLELLRYFTCAALGLKNKFRYTFLLLQTPEDGPVCTLFCALTDTKAQRQSSAGREITFARGFHALSSVTELDKTQSLATRRSVRFSGCSFVLFVCGWETEYGGPEFNLSPRVEPSKANYKTPIQGGPNGGLRLGEYIPRDPDC